MANARAALKDERRYEDLESRLASFCKRLIARPFRGINGGLEGPGDLHAARLASRIYFCWKGKDFHPNDR